MKTPTQLKAIEIKKEKAMLVRIKTTKLKWKYKYKLLSLLEEKQIFYALWKSIKESEVTEEMKDKWVEMGFENWKFIS
jgi:hypothetical protein